MSKLKFVGGLLLFLGILTLGGLVGGASLAVTGLIIAVGLHMLEFITLGTAQAVAIWTFAIGFVLGAIGTLINLAILSG